MAAAGERGSQALQRWNGRSGTVRGTENVVIGRDIPRERLPPRAGACKGVQRSGMRAGRE